MVLLACIKRRPSPRLFGPRLGRARTTNVQSQPHTSEDVRPASRHYSVRLKDARNSPLRPFKAVARVQIPLGPPSRISSEGFSEACQRLPSPIGDIWGSRSWLRTRSRARARAQDDHRLLSRAPRREAVESLVELPAPLLQPLTVGAHRSSPAHTSRRVPPASSTIVPGGGPEVEPPRPGQE
jgi:hypothetical protein